MRRVFLFSWLFALLGCGSDKQYTAIIEDFDVGRYMGKWHEIARIDNRFQRGLVDVTAHYRLKDNGDVEVINRGYSTTKGRWSRAEANATTTDTPNYIRVSFFPLIKGDYWVLHIDPEYTKAVVSGGKEGYLWILARSPRLTSKEIDELTNIAHSYGFNTDRLIFSSTDSR